MENFDWYTWVILPLIVFLARMTDVTLGTLRIMFTSRGKRNVAPLLGFVEVLIWIMVVGQVIQNVSSIVAYIGYAGGFAAGTFIGMKIEERLAYGTLVVRTILSQGGDELAKVLREAGYGVTAIDGKGAEGDVKLLFTIIKRKDLEKVANIIRQISPNAFFSVEEVRTAESGIFPMKAAGTK